ncbi:hypothetical protein G6O67_003346 [Ophiocordyceps sinensis]|uniref:Tyrosinase copper-binding domain-containing protein n=1 Tax=Ophiocordyceps sinensis TaxID=72228 RepID=A0A8H4V879_9HYPO|nr:hypothetical protein G6O67_003346 [Ophiocordyceps sinensis]
MPRPRAEPKYAALEDSDSDGQNKQARVKSCFVYGLTALGLLGIFWAVAQIAQSSQPAACANPPIRREWRALKPQEQHDFIRAIKCMAKTSSSWQPNRTIYDDIAVLHGGIGSLCHRSACFLPWHRHVLSVIESMMRSRCAYQGSMPYWDWSLDWMNLARSSIWDNSAGFGGDGDPDGAETVGDGRCVIDGPFADLRPIIYNHTLAEHCLSRGFRDGNATGRLSGEKFSPENMGDILRQDDYSGFLRRVERDLHNTLHNSVNGDFKAMTAANDPLFFLHHGNLDRLWWRWQRENPRSRLLQYLGRHMHNSTGAARLDDVLMFDGFTENVAVHQVMNAEAGLLCYTY